MTRRDREGAATATSDHDAASGDVLLVRRNRFSDAALLVAGLLLVALPVAVAVAIGATVVRSGSNAGGVAIGLVVPLALLAFSAGVVRPLVTGRRVTLVLGSDALVVHDRSLFRGAEAIPRSAVAAAWIGPAVDGWLADREPGSEVALAPDDEPVDLLLLFDELVLFDHARRKASRPKGEHRSALPQPDRPAGHLWVPLADPDAAGTALRTWLPDRTHGAPIGAHAPDLT